MSTTQHTQPLSRDAIREIFVAHGFTVKEGQTDLKPYVYAAADALISAALASAPTQPDDQEREKFVNWLNGTYPRSHTKGDAEEHWRHEHISALAWKAGRAEMASAFTQPGACQACGSDSNERDELIKAEREIARLGEVVAKERASRQAAQIKVADLQARINRAGVEKRSAIYRAVKEALAQAQPSLTDGEIEKLVYAQDPKFDQWHEGLSIDDVIAIVRAALSTQAAQPGYDSLGIPKSCGGPLCRTDDHHPLCKLADQPDDVAALRQDLARAHDSANDLIIQLKTLQQEVRELKAFRAMVNRYKPELPADPDGPRDVWYWQGDHMDHLESMTHTLPIVIRAEQLRELLAGQTEQPAQARGVLAEIVQWQYRDANDDGTWSAWIGCDRELEASQWRQVRGLVAAAPSPQQSDERRIDDYATEINRLRNVVQAACSGGLDHMIERWKVLFPEAPVPTVRAAPQQAQGAEPDFERMRHIANEWADMAANGMQWLRNIKDGISTADDAIANMNKSYEHCRKVNDAPGRYGGAVPKQAEPLHIGACITDGRLHATVMRRESNGDVTVLACAEMPVDKLHKHDCLAEMAPVKQAEPLSDAVKLNSDRYLWLRNEAWAGYNQGKGFPHVFTVDGAGNRRTMLAEDALDAEVDAARGIKGAK